jgi:hypothetical protein
MFTELCYLIDTLTLIDIVLHKHACTFSFPALLTFNTENLYIYIYTANILTKTFLYLQNSITLNRQHDNDNIKYQTFSWSTHISKSELLNKPEYLRYALIQKSVVHWKYKVDVVRY